MRQNTSIPLTDGSSLAATVSLPEKPVPAGGWPAVVVLHEGLGLAPDIVAVADRFAAHGWVAVAPDLFSHGTKIACLARAMQELLTGKPGQVTADIDATRAWLAARDDVDGARLGVIGFCMGGGFALPGCGRRR
jgi:carboxymethylenebutenolidase